jgi:putative integral membrane protein (TIGR02587 family)
MAESSAVPAAPQARRSGRHAGHAAQPSLRESLQEYGRGIAGGLLFSLPLLYTMEMWWSGITLPPARMLTGVVITLALLLGYNRFSGLREDATWLEVVIDSVEEFGLGVVVAILALALLGRLDLQEPLAVTIGKIVVESLVVAIGVSVGTAQLGVQESQDQERGMVGDGDEAPAGVAEQVVIALCGAVLFATNVAPTEEVLVLGTELGTGGLLALVGVALVLGMLLLHYSGFMRSSRRVRDDTLVWVLGGTVMTYAVSLLASVMLLWFFGRFAGQSLIAAVGQVVVLAVPAMLGASAGRLLLQ